MSTTAARIPAFRQCILPAGWDMARLPAVPGRALARPPRAPAGPALRRLLPAPAPAPGPPSARLAWAPPRLGAPRGSGDWALTSLRPSASPRGPPGGWRPLAQRGHFQGSLRARRGRAAPGLRLQCTARALDPAPAPPLGPRPGAPRLLAVQAAEPPAEGGGPLVFSALGATRPRSPTTPRPGSFPSRWAARPLALPRLSPSVPSSALPVPRPRRPGPGLSPWAKAADALSQPGPPGYFSDAVTVFKTGRKNMHREEMRFFSPSETAPARGHRRGLRCPRPGCRAVRRTSRAKCAAPALPGRGSLTF